MRHPLFFALVLAAPLACQKTQAPSEAPQPSGPEPAAAETSTATATTAASAPTAEGWTAVPMDADAPAALTMAREARDALAQRLMGTLKGALAEGDFTAGIEACKSAAPAIASSVSDEKDLRVGRTSFRVRNPDNTPPDFAEPVVEARWAKEGLFRGPEGQLGYVAPIRMKKPCLKCHGSAADVPDEVASMLAEAYPEDEATGFAEGDLRGWFWVEVPAGG